MPVAQIYEGSARSLIRLGNACSLPRAIRPEAALRSRRLWTGRNEFGDLNSAPGDRAQEEAAGLLGGAVRALVAEHGRQPRVNDDPSPYRAASHHSHSGCRLTRCSVQTGAPWPSSASAQTQTTDTGPPDVVATRELVAIRTA
jgi:hypothetical protein